MFLKRIDLFGFKSFADRSTIEFTDGIAALIGPNGCGKSNVVDAVKWVLGEQATRSLRADRMEDIIFNGTDSRKAVNVAEVTLTLENDGVLPLEFPEVSVRRRLFRSGESEYYINGAPVKLRELRELFYDTGIGKSAYSIMEQGKIDQILSNRPEERRALFEEAAGITRFKMRGREADRKLEQTERNMHEVETVLAEVKRSYDTLKGQAATTTRYRELREELFHAEVDQQRSRLARLREEENALERSIAEGDAGRAELRAEIDRLNEKLERELERVSGMESRVVELQKQLYRIGIEKDSRRERIRLVEEQHAALLEQAALEEARLAALERKAESLQEQQRAATDSETATRRRIEETDNTSAQIESRLARNAERRSEARAQIDAAEKQIAQNETQVAQLQEELRGVTDELVHALDVGLRESGYSTAARSHAEEELQQAQTQVRIILDGREAALADRVGTLTDPGERRSAVAAAFEALRTAADALVAAIERFRGAIPRFLDEFVAPEGTITRKRSLDDRIEALQEHTRGLRDTIRSLDAELVALRETQELERARLEEMKVTRAQLGARLESERATVARLEGEHRDIQRQREEARASVVRTRERATQMLADVAQVKRALEQLAEDEQAMTVERESLESSISSDSTSLQAEEQRIKQRMQRLAESQSRIEALHLQRAEKRAEMRTIHDTFQERHGRDLREFEERELMLDGDPRRLRDRIAALRSELRDLGNVNLMAVEEFNEVSDRYEFLAGQLGDLKQARDDLDRVTSEIKRESQQLFVETYNRIRKNFHTVFRRLFGGGRAELRLADPEAVLESGIEILVQPPGKKLENIALLSGGERSLTAVALMFATFMVRPAPFTLLDEIDAALDESNVGRFVAMLHEFAEQSQFVIITHNKRTVAGAHTLVGVTMEEGGVSKVVSLKIQGQPVAAGSESGNGSGE